MGLRHVLIEGEKEGRGRREVFMFECSMTPMFEPEDDGCGQKELTGMKAFVGFVGS